MKFPFEVKVHIIALVITTKMIFFKEKASTADIWECKLPGWYFVHYLTIRNSDYPLHTFCMVSKALHRRKAKYSQKKGEERKGKTNTHTHTIPRGHVTHSLSCEWMRKSIASHCDWQLVILNEMGEPWRPLLVHGNSAICKDQRITVLNSALVG